eukprot:s1_g1442.t1
MRSFLFNLVFYGYTGLVAIACLILVPIPSAKPLETVVHWWARSIAFALRWIAGIKLEVRGHENIPKKGPSLIASKHQSFSDGVLMLSLVKRIATVAMKDLLQYPAIGRIMTKLDMIMVDTCGGGTERNHLSKAAQRAYDNDRHILIYPEGQLVPVGDRERYKVGVYHLYDDLDLPVVPVATNAGVCWQCRAWEKKPGTITMSFLEPIKTGLDKDTFMRVLEDRIEAETDRLALGAFNDNVFKNALVILLTFSAAASLDGIDTQTLVALAGAIFIAPFFLFSAPAGQLADRYPKADLVRIIKLCEIGIMALAAIGFFLENQILLLGVLFLLGTQSAFFGPLKFGMLPDLLDEDELIGGNALIETATFLVILIGTLLGTLLILRTNGLVLVSVMGMAIAVAGWLAARRIPDRPAASPDLKINWNIATETVKMVSIAYKDLPIFRSIIGISWFWLVGSVFIILFPVFSRDVLSGNEQIVSMMLAIFAIGIGVGSLACDKLLGGKVRDYYVPVGSLGITLFSVDLFFASEPLLATAQGEFIGVQAFLAESSNWRIVGDLFGLSVCGGLFIVPLYAILQSRSASEMRSRLVAANNALNALAMVGASGLIFWLSDEGISIPGIFLTIGLLNIPVTLYVCFVVISTAAKKITDRIKSLT